MGHISKVNIIFCRISYFILMWKLYITFTNEIFFPVRSLASVSLRKTLNSHTPFHFDYFTVDLNEEYSALFGGVLKDQREFVHHSLHRILELYRNNANKPSSVILIGHSMVCNVVNCHSHVVLVCCKTVVL